MPGQLLGQDSALAQEDISVVELKPVPNSAPPYDGEADDGIRAAIAPVSGIVAGSRAMPPAEPSGDWPGWFARMLIEALGGERAARQVLPCLSKRARSQFGRLLPSFSGAGDRVRRHRPRVVRVVATRPASGVIEMSVIANFGPRTRALALRLERPAPEDRWTCTEIEAA